MHIAHMKDPYRGETFLVAVGPTESWRIDLGDKEPGFAPLLRLSLAEIRSTVLGRQNPPADFDDWTPLTPCDGRMEVWAAGVTYLRSRDARIEESVERSVYDRVYEADRPELFLKSVPWRTVTDHDGIAIRSDSPLNVPEPELALVVNAHQEIVGYTVCNDVSSRSIEGENPLYLPQAKVYTASCALASHVRPAWEIDDPDHLSINAEISRAGQVIWRAQASTAELNRTFAALVEWLFAQQDFPDGVILSTGTSIVPPMETTLEHGDIVTIRIDEVGELVNHVDTTLTSRKR